MDNGHARLVGLTYDDRGSTCEVVAPLPGMAPGYVAVLDGATTGRRHETLAAVLSMLEGLPEDMQAAGDVLSRLLRVQQAVTRLSAAVMDTEAPGMEESLKAVGEALETAALEAEAAADHALNPAAPRL